MYHEKSAQSWSATSHSPQSIKLTTCKRYENMPSLLVCSFTKQMPWVNQQPTSFQDLLIILLPQKPCGTFGYVCYEHLSNIEHAVLMVGSHWHSNSTSYCFFFLETTSWNLQRGFPRRGTSHAFTPAAPSTPCSQAALPGVLQSRYPATSGWLGQPWLATFAEMEDRIQRIPAKKPSIQVNNGLLEPLFLWL